MGTKSSRRICRPPNDVKNVIRKIAGKPMTEPKENENFSSSLKAVSVLPLKMIKTEFELSICRLSQSEYSFTTLLRIRADTGKVKLSNKVMLDLISS